MTPTVPHRLATTVVLAALALGPMAAAQTHAPSAPAAGSDTAHMQGDDEQSWINDPHMRAFYQQTVLAFAQGPDKVNVADYEQKSFAIFREFGAARGVGPMKMQDHLKLIPRQVVQIVREDPHVLDSYDNFVAATFGPR
jgi:hypothetical protein